jgi:lysophospholipase L1-like esterase
MERLVGLPQDWPVSGSGHLRRFSLVGLAAMVVMAGQALHRHPDPEPVDLAAEVARIRAMTFERDPGTPVVVFTGSSSIRLWKSLKRDFPRVQAVNTGFGGSTMSSLAQYSGPLIARFQPDRVVIHEGDNDIAAGSTPPEIIADTRRLLRQLRQSSPHTHVVLMSAKPSPARWRFQQTYRDLNQRYARLAERRARVGYADVWEEMLDDAGYPRPELFLPDELHLNAAGYAVWADALAEHVPTSGRADITGRADTTADRHATAPAA